jgi:hypothetical protein
MDFLVYKSLLYLATFNDVTSRHILKDKIVDIDAPDPTGEQGRPRQRWRATTESGEYRYYTSEPKVGEDAKPDDEHEEADREQGEPKVYSEVAALQEGLKSGKAEGAADQVKSFMNRAMKQTGKLKKVVKPGSEEHKKFGEVLGLLQRFSEQKSAAGEDPGKLSEALSTYKQAAEKLQEVTDDVNKRGRAQKPKGPDVSPVGDKKEEKPEEGSAEKRPEEKPTEEKKDWVYGKADLGNAEWEGKIEAIEKATKTKTKERKYIIGKENVNAAMFDSTEGGVDVVYKPESLGVKSSKNRDSLRGEVSCSTREVAGFELDRILGFGVVPPTFMRDSEITETDIRELSKNPKWGGSKTSGPASGSAQFKVDAKSLDDIEEESGKKVTMVDTYKKLSPEAKFDFQKLAIFDYISGNTDRHLGNVLFGKNQVYAIDNGLCFPNKSRHQLHSRPLMALSFLDEKIDKRILSRLSKVNPDSIRKSMSSHGMGEEAEQVIARLSEVVKSKGSFYGLDVPGLRKK